VEPDDRSMEGEPLPEEEASLPALAAAQDFFNAVARGDRSRLWELLSENARAFVLNIAMERGMDFDLGTRIRGGTATDEEMDEYLTTLLEGVRRDLRGMDLSRLVFESTAEPHAPLQVRVTYLLQMQEAIGGIVSAIPAGSLIMSYEADRWRVERLVPRPG
jgi:hypothetical protein